MLLTSAIPRLNIFLIHKAGLRAFVLSRYLYKGIKAALVLAAKGVCIYGDGVCYGGGVIVFYLAGCY